MLRFGTAIARLRAYQLDAYEGGACKEANLARGRQPVPIVDVDRCLHEKAFIVWFMAEEIRSGDQPLRAATPLVSTTTPQSGFNSFVRSRDGTARHFDPRRTQIMQAPCSPLVRQIVAATIFTDGRRCKTHASRLCAPRGVGSGWRSARG